MRYRCQAIAINTGLRQSNLCGLQWTWEVAVPEIARSVFVIPAEAFKTKCPPVVILKSTWLGRSSKRNADCTRSGYFRFAASESIG